MSWEQISHTLGLVLLVAGAVLCLTAAIGLLRFRDLLTRMHAATKPQVLGVLLVLLGVALSKEGGLHIGMLLLIGVFQMLTIPVGAHMVGRAGFRTGQVAPSDVHLGPASERAPDELGGARDDQPTVGGRSEHEPTLGEAPGEGSLGRGDASGSR
jgi:multicomponent Na+:H+ antiporter subunit G